MKRIWLLLTIFSLLIITNGCNNGSGNNPIEVDDSIEIMPLESDLYISVDDYPSMNVNPPSESQRLFLSIKSKEYYANPSYDLAYSVSLIENNINIEIEGVSHRTTGHWPCVLVSIGGYNGLELNNGNYVLAVQYNNSVDRYQIIVDDESITTNPITSTFTTPYWNKYWRYDENTFACAISHGYDFGSGGFEEEQIELYEAFLDTIRTFNGVTEISYPEQGMKALLSQYAKSSIWSDFEFMSSFFHFEDDSVLDEIRTKLDNYNNNFFQQDEYGQRIKFASWGYRGF
jgi:hypothetical protein